MNANYALIDAAADATIAHTLHTLAGRANARALFERQPEKAIVAAGPWLLLLDDHPGLQQVLPPLERHVGALAQLRADADMDTVFYHLERQLDVRLANGNLALLRFWDCRALHRLWMVMTPLQRRRFMGPVTHWSFQLQGRVCQLDRPTLEEL